VNSVRFASTASETLALKGVNVISSGGILETTAATISGHISTISGGTLEGSPSGDLIVNQWDTSSGVSLTISSVIANNGGASAFTKSGPGLAILSGANTYTGATYVNAGVLSAGIISVANTSGAFGKNSAVVMANTPGATLGIAGFNTQIGSLTGGGTNGGNVALGPSTLTVGGDSTSPAAYAGVISGLSGSLAKIGTGTLTLSGINTYTGATTVSAGTLLVSGAITGSTATVNASGTLAGTGTIAPTASTGAAVTINGTLTPAPGTIGNINFTLAGTATLAFGSSSTLNIALSNTDTGDDVVFGSTPASGEWLSGPGNATLALSGSIDYGNTYTIFQNAIANAATGAFTFAAITGYDTVDYTAVFAQSGNNYDLSFTPVPEPGTWAMLLTGGAMFLAGRRFRKRS
jgi:autotransporter-associated beta strand protein